MKSNLHNYVNLLTVSNVNHIAAIGWTLEEIAAFLVLENKFYSDIWA